MRKPYTKRPAATPLSQRTWSFARVESNRPMIGRDT